MTQEQDELDAYFWKRARIIVIVLPLLTVAGLMVGPYGENRYESVRYHSDKTAAMVKGKTEYAPWYRLHPQYLVTYEYSIGDEKYTATEDMEYKECFDAVTVGRQTYVYFDRSRPDQSYTECHLNRLTARKKSH